MLLQSLTVARGTAWQCRRQAGIHRAFRRFRRHSRGPPARLLIPAACAASADNADKAAELAHGQATHQGPRHTQEDHVVVQAIGGWLYAGGYAWFKSSSTKAKAGQCCCSCRGRGWRRSSRNLLAATARTHCPEARSLLAAAGVFDGHNGDATARYLVKHLKGVFQRLLEEQAERLAGPLTGVCIKPAHEGPAEQACTPGAGMLVPRQVLELEHILSPGQRRHATAPLHRLYALPAPSNCRMPGCFCCCAEEAAAAVLPSIQDYLVARFLETDAQLLKWMDGGWAGTAAEPACFAGKGGVAAISFVLLLDGFAAC